MRLSTEREGGVIVKQAVQRAVQRADLEEWRILDDLYPALRRFAAVAAPADLEPDDLVQEALVKVLKRRSLSDLDHPAHTYARRWSISLRATIGVGVPNDVLCAAPLPRTISRPIRPTHLT